MPHKTYFKEDTPKKHKPKRRTSQQIRSDWINLCLCLWSMIIVKRDSYCQYTGCGSTDGLTGHHIVTRGSTAGCKLAWVDLDNGVALCIKHHGIAHGRGRRITIHDFVKFINEWLHAKGLDYDLMKATYSVLSKIDIKVNFFVLRNKCGGMQIPYEENKKYQRLTKKLGNTL